MVEPEALVLPAGHAVHEASVPVASANVLAGQAKGAHVQRPASAWRALQQRARGRGPHTGACERDVRSGRVVAGAARAGPRARGARAAGRAGRARRGRCWAEGVGRADCGKRAEKEGMEPGNMEAGNMEAGSRVGSERKGQGAGSRRVGRVPEQAEPEAL